MKTDPKIKAIKKLMKQYRRDLNRACKNDQEYTTSQGNGVNSSECDSFFSAFEEDLNKILDDPHPPIKGEVAV
jgi:hypothetical protein